MNSVSSLLKVGVPSLLFSHNRLRLFAPARIITGLLILLGLSQETVRAEGVVTNCTTEAFRAALTGGGTVTFTNNCSLTLTQGVRIASDTTIDGGANNVTISGPSATNVAGVRLFLVNPGVTLTLLNLTLSNGRRTNGGAIFNQGNLVAIDCTFSSNKANGISGAAGSNGSSGGDTGGDGNAGGNGGPALGGAIYNSGFASFSNCTFHLNTASGGIGGKGGDGGSGDFSGGDGGRGGNAGRAQGGAIYNLGELILANCAFAQNTATGGVGGAGGTGGGGPFPGANANGGAGAAGSGAAIFNLQTAEISNCAFNNNRGEGGSSAAASTASNGDGRDGVAGGGSFGGGIFNFGQGSIINCTFFKNHVTGGTGGTGGPGDFLGGDGGDGGTASGGGVYNSGNITVTHVTLFGDGATGGAGGTNGAASFPGDRGVIGASQGGNIANIQGTFVLQNSIVASNTGGRNGFGAIIDSSVNISSDATLGLSAFGSRNNTNPRLGPFQDNGGPTRTMALLANSPAINAAEGGFCPETDQRGVARPVDDFCDVGAYEFTGSPVIVTQPISQTATNGNPVTFSVAAIGELPLGYQWRFNESDIPGARGSSYTISRVEATNAGNYQVVVTNRFGEDFSDVVTLTVFASPSITQQPTNQTVVEGSSVEFIVTAAGDAPLGYQWRFNGTDLSGETSDSLMLDNVQTNQAGSYQVVVANAFGSITSMVATLTVTMASGAPVITVPPASVTTTNDSPVTFSVTATGTVPLSYQWSFNGTPIPGATNSSYSLAAVQPADSGTYEVVVSNSIGEASAEATLTILDTPPPTFEISGRVVFGAAGLSDIPVSVGTNTTLTDTNGNYIFSSLAPGTYFVIPSSDCYEFDPPFDQLTVGPSTNSVTFVAARTGGFSISGHITDGVQGINGVTVRAGTNTTTTGSDGSYIFASLCPGTYPVAPTRGGYLFDPPSRDVPIGPNASEIDFTGQLVYNIRGRVLLDSGGLSGVTVMAGDNSATTDNDGFYILSGLSAGDYSVVASQPCYEFDPLATAVTLGPGVNDVNFAASAVSFTISGRVTDGTNGLTGVTVVAGNSETLTDTNGGYALSNLCAGTYSVEPSLSGYGFTFVSVTVGPSTNGVDFIASPLFTISGRVTRCGQGVSGVRVSSDVGGSATTGSEGLYQLNVQLPAGTYSVFTRNSAEATFYPTNRIVVLGPNATGVDFFDGIPCINSIRLIDGGRVELSLSTAPGQIYSLEASTNLMSWDVVFTTNGPANGMLQFIDASNLPSRFYRAVSP